MLVQVRAVPKCRSTHISNYQSTNANLMNMMKTSLTIIPNVSSGSPSSLLEIVHAYPLLHKGLGHLAALYLLYLLVARYKLSYHKTICYHLFQYLQRIPCWKPLIISFCSLLGSTLLLIERTTIDPLYLWVISDGSNYTDWVRNLRSILIAAQKNYVLEAPLGDKPAAGATPDVMNVWQSKADD